MDTLFDDVLSRTEVIPVHAALVELLKLEITPGLRGVAATEALGFLAEDEEMRPLLRGQTFCTHFSL